jgi:two-component system response regulator DevR
MAAIRLILFAQPSLVEAGIKLLLEASPDISFAGEAETAESAAGLISGSGVDVILADHNVGDGPLFELLGRLRSSGAETPVLVLTDRDDEALHRALILGGAHGLVLKSQPAGILFKAIEKVRGGEIWIDRSLSAKLFERVESPVPPPLPLAALTPRELEISRMVAGGLANRDVAGRLLIAEKTVRNHLTLIYSKLGLKNRVGLAIFISQNDGKGTGTGAL